MFIFIVMRKYFALFSVTITKRVGVGFETLILLVFGRTQVEFTGAVSMAEVLAVDLFV